jgi:medium-chain acyl-[acyl-carrier-protein] hydrolase
MSRWIECSRPRPGARARIFTLPYSGGGASLFRTWGADLPPELEVCAIQLPGREVRIREPPFRTAEALVEALRPELTPRLDLPFVIFGHSMGAVVAYALARALVRAGGPRPHKLLVSARPAPHLAPRHSPIHPLPDHELIDVLSRRYQAIPAAVLHEPELLALLLPMLRADLTLAETFHADPAPLPLPIHAFGGRHDHTVSVAELDAWRAHTAHTFTLETLDGGHFFLNEPAARGVLLASIQRTTADLLA